ncbi:MarR family winged helix-turn-helix transcriptional regulator [Pseudooceanicola nanhaiensis]|uniref:MarR family winged helix-turn-helix transcriptional regulator n=1 Tax=Pseudooceanicola nanhaiensis TaxID=375761 RepID=UPI001CD4E94B|nr:MarR family winged helix-turn-helix transcriptional regulator [Pseudooceanicola nanhaiensis]MCA0922674.1 MarR family winged helix-turn-helix transcriptional regulator [Pseudooceanicola nanhaiensis]
MAKKSSLSEDNNPIYQDIARFRAILFDAMLKPHDMTMSQGWVLVHLVRENGLRQSDLADRMDIATVTTSKLIDRLEARGYVERRSDPEDRRSNRVYASEAAKDVVRAMTKIIYEVDEIANAGIPEKDLETTLRVLQRMKGNLKDALAQR